MKWLYDLVKRGVRAANIFQNYQLVHPSEFTCLDVLFTGLIIICVPIFLGFHGYEFFNTLHIDYQCSDQPNLRDFCANHIVALCECVTNAKECTEVPLLTRKFTQMLENGIEYYSCGGVKVEAKPQPHQVNCCGYIQVDDRQSLVTLFLSSIGGAIQLIWLVLMVILYGLKSVFDKKKPDETEQGVTMQMDGITTTPNLVADDPVPDLNV